MMEEKTVAYWRQIIEDQMSSGLGPSVYCKRHNIHPSQFYRQRRALKVYAEEDLFIDLGCPPTFQIPIEDMAACIKFDGIALRTPKLVAEDFRKLLEVIRAVRLEFPVKRVDEIGSN